MYNNLLFCKQFDNVIRWTENERLDHLFERRCDHLDEGHLAVIAGDATATYREVDRRANQLARYLPRQGVRPGDRVGVMFRQVSHRKRPIGGQLPSASSRKRRTMRNHIRLAVRRDAASLPAVERSAAQRFREVPEVAWIADSGATSPKVHKHYIKEGTVWIAEDEAGTVVGFLTAERVGDDLHIWEISVSLDYQGQGIGRRLIGAAAAYAHDAGLAALTLTTFCNLRWNAPFYAKLGFEALSPGEDRRLARILDKEATSISGGPRCAMRKLLSDRTRLSTVRGMMSLEAARNSRSRRR